MAVSIIALCAIFLLHGINGCLEGFYKCTDDGRCIHKLELCDRYRDCLDGQDEEIGCKIKFNCTEETKFLCLNHECISKRNRCDGNFDCTDNSDEADCENHCMIQHRKYLCKSGSKCIDLRDVCNNIVDCLDESDEIGCPQESSNPVCSCEECVRTPNGTMCICNAGYRPVNNTSCEDIDECRNDALCEQRCTNTPGSYTCSCYSNFILENNGRTCKVDENLHPEETLLYTTTGRVNVVRAKDFKSLVSISFGENYTNREIGCNGFNECTFFKFNRTERILIQDYYVSIENIIPHKSTVRAALLPFCSSFNQVVIDGLTNNFYFACPREGIMVCSRNLSPCLLIRSLVHRYFKSVVSSVSHRLLFWLEISTSEEDKSSYIIRAGMDGSNVVVIVNDNLGSDYTDDRMAVDPPSSRLYFFNVMSANLESVKFDGTGRRTVRAYVFYPLSIVVTKRTIYWHEKHFEKIFACNKIGKGCSIIPLPSPINSLTAASVSNIVHINELFSIEEKYEDCVLYCSDMCMITSDKDNSTSVKSTCMCGDQGTLSLDGLLCQETSLLAGHGDRLFIIGRVFSSSSKVYRAPLDHRVVISAMTYDPVHGDIIFFDSVSKTVQSYNYRGRIQKIVLENAGDITTMKYDGYGNNIFVCNRKSNAIEVISLNKPLQKTVLVQGTTNRTLLDFTVAHKRGFIFIAFLDHDVNKTIIQRLFLNGSHIQNTVISDYSNPEVKLVFLEDKNILVYGLSIGTTESMLTSSSIDDAQAESCSIQTPLLSDIADLNGSLIFVGKNSEKIWMIDCERTFKKQLDFTIERSSFLKTDDNMKITTVTKWINTHSPCFVNNGGCEHVCMIIDISTNSKCCVCRSNYTLESDGLHCVKRGASTVSVNSSVSSVPTYTNDKNIAGKSVEGNEHNNFYTFVFFISVLATLIIVLTVAYVYRGRILVYESRFRILRRCGFQSTRHRASEGDNDSDAILFEECTM